MSKGMQVILVVMLALSIALQVAVLVEMRAHPAPPTMKEINERIMHWGQHFSAVSSDSSRIMLLQTELNKRFDRVDEKLENIGKATN